MVSYFDSQHPARGDKFVSRSETARALANQIRDKKFSTIYAPAGYGKATLVQKAFKMLEAERYPVKIVTMDLFNITTEAAFCKLYVDSCRGHIEDYNRDALLPIIMNLSSISTSAAINLPHLLSSVTGLHFVIYFKEFQNLLSMDGGEKLLKLMERELDNHQDVAYVVTGEQLNKMKEIFERRKFFYRINCNIPLEPLQQSDCISYLRNGFLKSGKDLDEDTALELYNISKGYPLVMNGLATICDTVAPGYINRRTFAGAVEAYLDSREYDYRFITGNLTGNQVNFLRAVCDGVKQFSSSEVLRKYHLHSSANVFRLKEALSKKEIVTFDSEERAFVIDPMFELWLKRRYFV